MRLGDPRRAEHRDAGPVDPLDERESLPELVRDQPNVTLEREVAVLEDLAILMSHQKSRGTCVASIAKTRNAARPR
jgi:hypothetical protein